jgi:hypothetical protein
MQVLPQALPTVQILQQDWAGDVERGAPPTPTECSSLLRVWDRASTVSKEVGAVWAPYRRCQREERDQGKQGSRHVFTPSMLLLIASSVMLERHIVSAPRHPSREGGHSWNG